uniref:Uncharacterized protein n=1 Tax=uncultured marine virus TaxID=186617 RepID=A0A0F7L4N6_9VIRU|nr:hypothetical protein [uncultured marine virus]
MKSRISSFCSFMINRGADFYRHAQDGHRRLTLAGFRCGWDDQSASGSGVVVIVLRSDFT